MAVQISEANVAKLRTGKRPPRKRCETPGCPELAVERDNYCERHLREIDRWH